MTRIDGIIVLDPNGKPLITSHFPLHPPSYPSTHIDAFNHSLKRSRMSNTDLDPILWVNTLSREGMMVGAGLCHLEREGLRYLVPVGHEVNPLYAFSFLESFLATLRDYLGNVTESTIKEEFDIVYMLIEEMLDEGHPMTMETAMLKDIVLPPSLMRKLLNVAGVSGIQSASAPFTTPIPWRRQGVRHSNNEIYFDIEESLDAIVDRRGHVLSSNVWGRINSNSRLTGNPDLLLTFANPNLLTNCSFHPCIRYTKWEEKSVLSFIPPDGRFKLLEYQAAMNKVQPPLSLKTGMSIEENGGRFSLALTSRSNHRPVEDIVISIYLGQGATSVSATATGDRRPIGMGSGSASGGLVRAEAQGDGWVGGGTWEFDPHTQILRWSISSLTTTERPPTLSGSFVSTEPLPCPSPAFEISCGISNHSFSGLRVDQLKVLGDAMYKPFKGVRMLARAGRMEVRW